MSKQGAKAFFRQVRTESPDYIPWFIGDTATAIAGALTAVPMTLVSYQVTGDVSKAGLVAAVASASYFAMSLPAGILIDAIDKRRLLAFVGAANLIVWGLFSALLLAGSMRFPLLITFALASGLTTGIGGGLTNAILRFVVSERLLAQANARNQTRDSLVWLLGMPLGGWLYSLARPLPFVVQALLGFGPLYAAMKIRTSLVSEKPDDDVATPSLRSWWATFFSNVGYSLTWIWRHRTLRALFVFEFLVNFANFFLVQAVDLNLAQRGFPGVVIGLVSGAFSLSLLAAGFLSDRITALRPGGQLLLMMALWQLAAYLFIAWFGHSVWFLVPAIAVLLLPGVAASSYVGAYLALSAPKDKIARAAAGARLIMGLAPSGAAALAGFMLHHIGFGWAVLTCVGCLVGACAIAATPLVRGLVPQERFDELPVYE